MYKLIVVTAAILVGAGCGSAQIHYQDTEGGILTLQGSTKKALEDARAKMAAHCGPGQYEVTKRETVVVGQEDYTRSRTDYEETEDTDRTNATVGETHSDTDYGYDHESEASGEHHEHDYAGSKVEHGHAEASESGGGFESTDEGYYEESDEDENTVRDGTEETNTVSGTRDVTESRVHYRCATGPSARL